MTSRHGGKNEVLNNPERDNNAEEEREREEATGVRGNAFRRKQTVVDH